MRAWFRWYCWTSYRRKILDQCLIEHQSIFRGVVLDIGGRDRGRFKKPKTSVDRWIFADINPEHHPDVILDVAHMDTIASESIDVISACELFEHVEQIDKALNECVRVLKPTGHMIISVPFLYPIHADPHDYQRWTKEKWNKELSSRGFFIETNTVTGMFFTVIADAGKQLLLACPRPVRWIGCFLFPFLDVLACVDKMQITKTSYRLSQYHGGYFLIAKKP